MEEKPEFATQEQTQEELPATQQESLSPEKKKNVLEAKARRFFSAMVATAVLGLSAFDAEKLSAEPKELKLPPTVEKVLTPEEARVVQLRAELGAPQKAERILTPEEKRSEHIKYLQKMAIESPTENYSISVTTKNGFFVETEDLGVETSVELPMEDVYDAFFEDENAEIEIFHTHPLKQIEKFPIDNKGGHSMMPPSIIDLLHPVSQRNLVGKESSHIKNTVVDPTGLWEFSIDPNSSLYKKLNEARESVESISFKDFNLSMKEGLQAAVMIEKSRKELSNANSLYEAIEILRTKFPEHAEMLKKAEDAIPKVFSKLPQTFIAEQSDFATWPNQEETGDDSDTTLITKWKEIKNYEQDSPIGKRTDEEVKEFTDFWSRRGLKLKRTEFKNSATNGTK